MSSRPSALTGALPASRPRYALPSRCRVPPLSAAPLHRPRAHAEEGGSGPGAIRAPRRPPARRVVPSEAQTTRRAPADAFSHAAPRLHVLLKRATFAPLLAAPPPPPSPAASLAASLASPPLAAGQPRPSLPFRAGVTRARAAAFSTANLPPLLPRPMAGLEGRPRARRAAQVTPPPLPLPPGGARPPPTNRLPLTPPSDPFSSASASLLPSSLLPRASLSEPTCEVSGSRPSQVRRQAARRRREPRLLPRRRSDAPGPVRRLSHTPPATHSHPTHMRKRSGSKGEPDRARSSPGRRGR